MFTCLMSNEKIQARNELSLYKKYLKAERKAVKAREAAERAVTNNGASARRSKDLEEKANQAEQKLNAAVVKYRSASWSIITVGI